MIRYWFVISVSKEKSVSLPPLPLLSRQLRERFAVFISLAEAKKYLKPTHYQTRKRVNVSLSHSTNPMRNPLTINLDQQTQFFTNVCKIYNCSQFTTSFGPQTKTRPHLYTFHIEMNNLNNTHKVSQAQFSPQYSRQFSEGKDLLILTMSGQG